MSCGYETWNITVDGAVWVVKNPALWSMDVNVPIFVSVLYTPINGTALVISTVQNTAANQ